MFLLTVDRLTPDSDPWSSQTSIGGTAIAREMIRSADARRMRIATARVAAVDKEATSDLNAGIKRQSGSPI